MMTQQDVYDFLKAHSKRWWDTAQVARGTGLSRNAATRGCRKLREQDMVLFKSHPGHREAFLYKHKPGENILSIAALSLRRNNGRKDIGDGFKEKYYQPLERE